MDNIFEVLSEGKEANGIAECKVCKNLYDATKFDSCPYCYKEAHNLTGWIDNLPERVNKIPDPSKAKDRKP